MSTSKIVARRVPYKDFLQPALQRRFVLASALILVISYFEAVLVGSWHSWLWAWFPIIRTFFFFICAFSIILLRVAHYHVGIRTASSPIQVAQNALFAAKSWEILATYVVFGWFFSQFYLLYAADRLGLQWILHQAGDRARLNEKPIFFSTYFVTLAVVHAVHHIAADVDQLPLGTITPANLVSRINSKLPNIATKAAVATVAALMLHLLCYSLFMRSSAWGWALWSLRPFFNLPKSNMLPSIYPYHLWLFSRMVYVGWLLSFLWIAGNFGFSVLMKAEPLKHGKPITSESKDPNGSLLNGLKSKKFSVKCFAMWELAFVARDFEDRRKTIFDDIDRLDGPMWSQVYQVCLGVVTGVQQNMNNVGKQPEGPKVEEAKKEEARPKVAVPPSARNVCIQRPERDDIVTHVQKELKSISQSPGKTPLHELSPIARKAITDAKNKYLTMEQQEAMTRDGINSAVKTRVTQLLNHPIGVLIRRDFGQRLAAVVFDSEEVEISLYVNAVNVLTKLSVNSLAEDQYGHVQRDVASIIRTFTTTLNKLEAFATAFPTHWLDGNAERECRQVNELVGALRLGLRELLDAFGEFAEDLRLSRADMRQAMDATLEPQKVNDDTTSSTPISAGDNGINQSSYTPEVKLPSSPPHLLGLADFVEFGGSDNALAFPEREVSELLGFSDRYIPPPDANFLQIDMPLDPFSHSIFPYSSVARLETRHNPTNYNRSLHVSSYERERTSMNNINTLEDSSVYSTARQMLGSNCVGIDGQEPILELPWKDSVSPPTPSASSSPSLTQYQAHSQSRDQHQASASASASASTHSHLPPTPAIVTTPPSPTPSPSSQDAHELTTSTTSGFTCHYKGCNEAFTLDKDRERHERETHRQIKPFACSWCDDMFSRKGNRNRHMETCPTNPAVGGRRTWRPSSVALREKKDEVKEGVPEGYEENKKKRVVNEDEEEPGSDTGTSAMSVETSVKPRERKRRYDSGDENGMDDDDDDDDVDSLKRRLDFVESEVKIERAKRKAVETRLRKVVRSKLKSKRRRQG